MLRQAVLLQISSIHNHPLHPCCREYNNSMHSSRTMEQAMEEGITNSSSQAISSQSHNADFVSKLPIREGWAGPLVLYKNFWIRRPFAINIMHLQKSFEARQDDIIIAANPKCGTTWMKALVFTITNRSRYEFGNHPLLFRHPQEVVPLMEIPRGVELSDLDTLSSPRLLATHMPFLLLPNSITARGCRIVYICREPKDAFVSRWHFENKIGRGNYSISLEDALTMFSEGFSPYGPFWEHCLQYWRESIASPDKVLFLKYEDMTSEPVKSVKRIAAFLGVPFSIKEEEDGVPGKVLRLCSFEKLSSFPANQAGEISRLGNLAFDKSAFFRKGIVGDWVNHISEEMGRKIDCIMEEKLKGSGLEF